MFSTGLFFCIPLWSFVDWPKTCWKDGKGWILPHDTKTLPRSNQLLLTWPLGDFWQVVIEEVFGPKEPHWECHDRVSEPSWTHIYPYIWKLQARFSGNQMVWTWLYLTAECQFQNLALSPQILWCRRCRSSTAAASAQRALDLWFWVICWLASSMIWRRKNKAGGSCLTRRSVGPPYLEEWV